MTTRAIQTTIPGLSKDFAPMFGIITARAAVNKAQFDYNEDDLLADLDEGRFEWAWNIASKNAFRREIRIYAPCLDQHIAWLKDPKTVRRHYTEGEVLRALFPRRHEKPWVGTPDVTLAFQCSADHVIDLINERSFEELPGTNYSPGPHGAAQITFESVKQFLTTRRL